MSELSFEPGQMGVERKKDQGERFFSAAEVLFRDYFLSGPDDREDYEADISYAGSFHDFATMVKKGIDIRRVDVDYRRDTPREAKITLRSGEIITLKGRALQEILHEDASG